MQQVIRHLSLVLACLAVFSCGTARHFDQQTAVERDHIYHLVEPVKPALEVK